MNSTSPPILIKVGGNALTDPDTKSQIISQIAQIHNGGTKIVIVHGGGIEIKQLLDDVGLNSEFVGGHRKTELKTMTYVEMVLSGMVNKELVGQLNHAGIPAVGVSGKDAGMIKAHKRLHVEDEKEFDLGFVGDVGSVDTGLITTLLDAGYLPVVSPVSIGNDGKSYNINADMFAGHLAGAIGAETFVAMTNIDGLLRDLDDPGSLIAELTPDEARGLFGSVIQGGMIPKIEACLIAVEKGVGSAAIINGTKENRLLDLLLHRKKTGTVIKRSIG